MSSGLDTIVVQYRLNRTYSAPLAWRRRRRLTG